LKERTSEKDAALSEAPECFDALAQELFARGNCVRFKASGNSMHPFVRDGDVLLVEPASAEKLRVGDIAFCRRPWGSYVVHRVVNRAGTTLVTRGDNLSYCDEPVPGEQVLGRVVQIESRRRLVLSGWPGRELACLLGLLARSRSSTLTRAKRNLGRLWWLVGGRRLS
jgi:hypothetical protein